ncbi:hypothetical protein [Peribacillus simplex]
MTLEPSDVLATGSPSGRYCSC